MSGTKILGRAVASLLGAVALRPVFLRSVLVVAGTIASACLLVTGGASSASGLGGASGRTALTSVQTRGDWLQYRFDAAHTGANLTERRLGTGTVRRLRKAWSISLGEELVEPAVVGDVLYVASSGGRVHALSSSTGQEHWSAKIDAFRVSAPAVSKSTVYVVSDGGFLAALSREDGRLLWTRGISDLEGGFAPPAVVGSVVYVVGTHTVAVDGRTGRELWRRRIGCFWCSPAIARGTLYVPSDPENGNWLFALSTRSGMTRWRAPLPRGGTWGASPAVAGGRVYMQLARGSGRRTLALSAFDSNTGQRRWTASGGRSRVLPGDGPAVVGGTVYYGSRSGTLYALRATTGKQLWAAKFGQIVLEPVVANGVVYTGAGRVLSALSARTGGKLWSAALDERVATYPVVASGALYVGSSAGTLYRFDLGAA